jgi:hypothetical protein
MRDPFAARATGHYGHLYTWEGHEIIELNSPELLVKVSLTRGAEILELRDKRKNLDLLWHNHDDIVRNRPFISSRNSEFGNFLEHFSGGWQEVLPAAQYPVEYKGIKVGGHGEAALLSWNFEIVNDSAAELTVKFSVDLRLFPLRLTRVMTIKNGAIRFDETVENIGSEEIEFQWGQHLVLGGPFASPGAELIVEPGERFEVPHYPSPSYRFEVDQVGAWPQIRKANGEVEELRTLPVNDGSDGHVILGPMKNADVSLVNKEVGLAARMRWGKETYPYCWIWMVWGGIKQYPLWGAHRLVTIEPFSSPVIPLTEAIASGSALVAKPGGIVSSWVEFIVSEVS